MGDKIKGPGQFHFYDKETHYILLRKDSIDIEINTSTSDSSFWKVKWIDSDTYTSKFIRSTQNFTGAKLEFYLNSESVFDITDVRADYYLYKGSVKYNEKAFSLTDTVWFKPIEIKKFITNDH